jgi:hypothetical protein
MLPFRNAPSSAWRRARSAALSAAAALSDPSSPDARAARTDLWSELARHGADAVRADGTPDDGAIDGLLDWVEAVVALSAHARAEGLLVPVSLNDAAQRAASYARVRLAPWSDARATAALEALGGAPSAALAFDDDWSIWTFRTGDVAVLHCRAKRHARVVFDGGAPVAASRPPAPEVLVDGVALLSRDACRIDGAEAQPMRIDSARVDVPTSRAARSARVSARAPGLAREVAVRLARVAIEDDLGPEARPIRMAWTFAPGWVAALGERPNATHESGARLFFDVDPRLSWTVGRDGRTLSGAGTAGGPPLRFSLEWPRT